MICSLCLPQFVLFQIITQDKKDKAELQMKKLFDNILKDEINSINQKKLVL